MYITIINTYNSMEEDVRLNASQMVFLRLLGHFMLLNRLRNCAKRFAITTLAKSMKPLTNFGMKVKCDNEKNKDILKLNYIIR